MVTDNLREEFVALLKAHVPGLHLNGSKAAGHVPWREDKHPSFSADLTKGVWYDLARQEGGGVKEFKARLGLSGAGHSQARTIVATYDYRDEHGTLLYEVVRFSPKGFSQRRPDGNGGWNWDLNGVRRVLYRLPEVLKAETVCVVEGEKDADRLRSLGVIATCNPGGASKWREEYSQPLAGKRIVILPDNDEAGEQHALQVARSLLPVATAVKIVRLPGLAPKGDVFDWLEAGHSKKELVEVVKATPALQPEDLPSSTQTTRVTLRRPSELIARPISWRVEGILPDRMLTLAHARDKVGKTLFAWEAARAVLKQQALLGTFAVTPGRVVLALLDDPHELTVQRRDALGLTDCEDLRIVTPLDADLSDPVAFLADFKKECGEFKPQLIVVDALYHFAPHGRDAMNDAARMRGIMAAFNELAETLPAAVLLIAHDRKDGTDIAGSHVIRATAKALLHLTKPKWSNEDEEEDDGRRILTVVSKMTGEARYLLRCQGVGAWAYIGRGDSAHQARTTWAQDRVLTYLREGGEGTAQEIAKGAKIRREDALSVLTSLLEDGQVESELLPRADGKKGKGRLVYRLRPNVPDPGNNSPKERDGNNRSEAQKPVPNAEKNDGPNVPPAWNQAGTIDQTQKPTIDGLFCEDQTYCSQNPLSKGEDGNNSFSDSREEGEL